MLIRVLLLLEPRALGRRLARLLDGPNVLATLSSPPPGGLWEGLSRESCDLVIAGRDALPEPATTAVAGLRALPERPEVIVLHPHDDPRDRAALLSAGCLAVLSPELPDAELRAALASLVDRRRDALVHRLRADQGTRYRLDDFSSQSPAMRSLLDLARRVAAADSSLLILGETGVGKEWLARAIHADGRRAAAPFIAVNAAAMPESLLESELFGHERGAFTGAVRSRRGHFESAHRGTLFLDEIGDMPAHLQARLLRVLQDRKIQRVGGEQPIEVDVRVMAATNQNLEEAMRAKAFRRDLYYRLSVVTLTIPPLRDRREDVPPLVESYLERFRSQLGRPALILEPEALAALVDYAWPGNVRELINVVERAVLLSSPDGRITLADLPDPIGRPAAGGRPAPRRAGGDGDGAALPGSWFDLPLAAAHRQLTARLERAYLDHHLRATGGRVGDTARRAGLDPRSVYSKMRALGLRKEDYRAP